MSDGPARRRRIGVWTGDPITAAGLMSLLAEVGFDPVRNPELFDLDAMLVAFDAGSETGAEHLDEAAAAAGVPVVWLERSPGNDRGEAASSVRRVVHSHGRSPEAFTQALVMALNGHLDADLGSDEDDSQVVASGDNAMAHGSPIRLTTLEREVLKLLAEGYDTAEISAALFYSERTIKNTVARAVRRVGAANRSHAVASAIRLGIL